MRERVSYNTLERGVELVFLIYKFFHFIPV